MDFTEAITAFCRNALAPIIVEAIREAIKAPETPPDKEFISINDAARVFCVGKSTIFEYFNTGKLTRYKLGGKTLVSINEMRDLVAPESLATIGVQSSKGKKR